MKTLEERFNEKWIPVTESGCWLWTGATYNSGYGQIKTPYKSYRAHRVALMLAGVELKDDDLALHKCDNKLCVNPDHLYAGTHQDNMDDATSRGRRVCGEKHHSSKLTADDVSAIRAQFENGVSTVQVAKQYGICQATAYEIKSMKIWRNI